MESTISTEGAVGPQPEEVLLAVMGDGLSWLANAFTFKSEDGDLAPGGSCVLSFAGASELSGQP